MKHSTTIDRLRIATPCRVDWEQMTGNDHVRFCDQCQLHVYNISELSRVEAETLIASTEGQICARLYRRADGSVLTKDCPVGLRALRMRVSKRAAAVFATIASICGAVFGQEPSGKDKSNTSQTKITQTNSPSDQAATVFSGSVRDRNGAAIPQARISMINLSTGKTTKATANDEGRFRFDSLDAGNYSIEIGALGFITHRAFGILIERNRLTSIDATLEQRDGVEMGFIISDLPSEFDSKPGTTIMSGDLIRRFPIQ